MTILYEARLSDSAYVETVTYGRTVSAGSPIRPAEIHWHMVFVKEEGKTRAIVVAPLTTSGTVFYREGAEVLWIKFKLGTWLPHLPMRTVLDEETVLPRTTSQSFCLKGASWHFPNYDNVETFVSRLVCQDVLVRDPVVSAILQGQATDLSPRTVRHRFLHTVGISQNHIYQVRRAQKARSLLRCGTSILDTVVELGYFDQSHLSRSLKRWVGYTPTQLFKGSSFE